MATEAIQPQNLAEELKAIRKDLEYIDLRIDNKVFYKFMDGTQQETQSTQGEEISPVVEKKDEKKKKK